mmetsp:Transcript_11576/g.24423  ORF Transcript_11576/g.24423 Transcript_11576/m.24423 type:complete len:304 (-) Transcript_11576:1235-2146(-)
MLFWIQWEPRNFLFVSILRRHHRPDFLQRLRNRPVYFFQDSFRGKNFRGSAALGRCLSQSILFHPIPHNVPNDVTGSVGLDCTRFLVISAHFVPRVNDCTLEGFERGTAATQGSAQSGKRVIERNIQFLGHRSQEALQSRSSRDQFHFGGLALFVRQALQGDLDDVLVVQRAQPEGSTDLEGRPGFGTFRGFHPRRLISIVVFPALLSMRDRHKGRALCRLIYVSIYQRQITNTLLVVDNFDKDPNIKIHPNTQDWPNGPSVFCRGHGNGMQQNSQRQFLQILCRLDGETCIPPVRRFRMRSA